MKKRKSPRWANWDYSTEGYYFVTAVTKDRLKLFGNIVLDEFIEMRNIADVGTGHIDVGTGLRPVPTGGIWQPRFHDRIIRDEMELYNVRNYIQNNPRNWLKDDLKEAA